MNEPIDFEYNGNLYIRFNYRAYKLPGQHPPFIHDTALLDKLEKAYSDQQRAAAKGRRTSATTALHDLDKLYAAPTPRIERRPTPRQTREKRGGRVE